MKATVLGATGAIGKDLVEQLLKDDTFDRVDIFVRREVKVPSAKLVTHVVDFDHPEQWADRLTGDVLFSTLGTTIKAAGSQAAQWKVDYTPMPTEAVAAAMVRLAKSGRKGTEIIVSQDILNIE